MPGGPGGYMGRVERDVGNDGAEPHFVLADLP